jgi:hypothetical protein
MQGYRPATGCTEQKNTTRYLGHWFTGRTPMMLQLLCAFSHSANNDVVRLEQSTL